MKEFHYITLLPNKETGAKYRLTINDREIFITYFDTGIKMELDFEIIKFHKESDYNSFLIMQRVADSIQEVWLGSMKEYGLSLDSNCLDIIDESIKKTLGWSFKTKINRKYLQG